MAKHEVGSDLRQAGAQAAQQVQAGVTGGVRRAAPWLEALARFGYASKGVVYAAVGLLALGTALGGRTGTADSQAVFTRVQDLPLGGVLLWLLAVGLLGYAAWQLVRALLDPEGQGTRPGGAARRAGYLVSGVVNVGLALAAVRLGTGGGNPGQNLARQVLEWPGGPLLLGLAGLALLGAGAAQLVSAARGKFMEGVALRDQAARHADLVRRVGQFGIAARGLVLGGVGAFLLSAAFRDNAARVRDTGSVLDWLRDQPAGPWLLGLVALGTLAYGLWCFVQAAYRRIRVGV
ncbi:DUF1206 domain-containing protein [Deinococcus sp. MIMF12]|uniref:DUF1206 domain-containing protein n=1 Tax=Deinococcus rhizophilus TaxID=3049544 RepID=A0ABT7JEK7_9DEIO|nr:DUF1206 domain-containing protein [Deinococcus rhizophilus]MDL2342920.1 DUF1206 domain-containing protein [Deinococcus rhizophilus]